MHILELAPTAVNNPPPARPPHPRDQADRRAGDLLDRLYRADRLGRLDAVRHLTAALDALDYQAVLVSTGTAGGDL